MNCKFHKDLKGTNTCSVCGEWICENCVLEIENRVYCKECLKHKIRNESSTQKPYVYSNTRITQNKSSFVTLICSLIPGLAQVYLGYTKRGLIILSFFLIGIGIDAFSLLIMLSYIFGLFDAFRIKGNVERGIYQEDNVEDIKKFIKENKFFMFVVTVIIIIPMIFNYFRNILVNTFRTFNIYELLDIGTYDIEDIIPIVGVGLLILIIFRIINKRRCKKKDNVLNKKQ